LPFLQKRALLTRAERRRRRGDARVDVDEALSRARDECVY